MRGVAWWDDRATSGPSGRLLRRCTWNAPGPGALRPGTSDPRLPRSRGVRSRGVRHLVMGQLRARPGACFDVPRGTPRSKGPPPGHLGPPTSTFTRCLHEVPSRGVRRLVMGLVMDAKCVLRRQVLRLLAHAPKLRGRRGRGCARCQTPRLSRGTRIPRPLSPESVIRATRALVFRSKTWQRKRLLRGPPSRRSRCEQAARRAHVRPQRPAAPLRERARPAVGDLGKTTCQRLPLVVSVSSSR